MARGLALLEALSDGTRFKIVELLLSGERCVCEIIPHVKRAQPTVSLQLKKLEKAGVLKSRKDGKKVFYRIADNRVCRVFEALGNPGGKILKKSCCREGNK